MKQMAAPKFYTVYYTELTSLNCIIKCPQCKHRNIIHTALNTGNKHHVKQRCWYCRRVTFDITFIVPIQENKSWLE